MRQYVGQDQQGTYSQGIEKKQKCAHQGSGGHNVRIRTAVIDPTEQNLLSAINHTLRTELDISGCRCQYQALYFH